ncbi:Uncharacterised protein [Mycobacteroides abscessus subsp. abscessus]|uniref:beta barrel domain-containing protein n=1 Tax=Mycobacteroides abscessus TaxID=36809 RepID=UPI00092C92FF|nr:hypothetical protein [Mycobacteroides abscessus]SHU27602.1 Uncharacterised protein [Mycobacteroides abscessus subsp. abscessus]
MTSTAVTRGQWQVGQTVLLKDGWRYNAPVVEVPVTRIARKYVYVTQHGRERKFNIENGAGDAAQIFTRAGWADRLRNEELLGLLRDAGVEFNHRGHFSTVVLEQFWAVVTAARAERVR